MKWVPCFAFLSVLGVSLAGCGKGENGGGGIVVTKKDDEPTGPPLFEDVTRTSGIDAMYKNGEESMHYAILESLGGGVGLIDFDGDGLLDVVVAGGGYFTGPKKQEIKGYPTRLFKNLGGLRFQEVTKEVGLDQVLFYSHGVAVADYDRDGWPDLLITGYRKTVLLHN